MVGVASCPSVTGILQWTTSVGSMQFVRSQESRRSARGLGFL